MIIQIIAAFVGTVSFSVIYNISRYQLFYCGIVGAIGWFVYLLAFLWSKEMIFSSFIASVVVSIISHTLAKVRKNPVTIYQIGGIFPLVPGAGMYKTLYFIVNEEYTKATYYLYQTLQIAGGIAAGMVLIASASRLAEQKALLRNKAL